MSIWSPNRDMFFPVFKGHYKLTLGGVFRVFREIRVHLVPFFYLGFCIQRLSKGCSLYCVCEFFVRSRGVCLHIHLVFPISRLMSRVWWSIQLQIWELKDIQAGVLVLIGIQERSSPWTWSYHVVVVVSFLLKIAIGC